MDEVIEKDNERGKAEFYLATVTNWFPATSEVQIKLDGDDSAMTKKYKTACGTVGSGSRVVVMKQSGTYVVLGSIGGTGGSYITNNISDIATAASGITLKSGTYYAQSGNVASLCILFTPTSTFSNTIKQIATLKSGKRPAIMSDAQFWSGNGAYIGSDGAIYVNGSATDTSGNYFLFSTYVIA